MEPAPIRTELGIHAFDEPAIRKHQRRRRLRRHAQRARLCASPRFRSRDRRPEHARQLLCPPGTVVVCHMRLFNEPITKHEVVRRVAIHDLDESAELLLAEMREQHVGIPRREVRRPRLRWKHE
jgi:hypothetical protein